MRKHWLSSIAIMLSLLSFGAIEFAQAAQSSIQASIGISSGVLSVVPGSSSTSFNGVTLNGMQQTVSADVGSPLTITDSTGWGNGWTLQVSASPFEEQTPSNGVAAGTTMHSLPAGSLTLTTVNNITPMGTTSPPPTNQIQGAVSVIDNGAITVVNASPNNGMGIYQIGFPAQALSLTINPGTTYVDTVNYPGQATSYTSTLTWTVSSGPTMSQVLQGKTQATYSTKNPQVTYTQSGKTTTASMTLSGYSGYGGMDILYTSQYSSYSMNIPSSVDPNHIVSATLKVTGVLDDHSAEPASSYTGGVAFNSGVLANGPLPFPHGSPWSGPFSNLTTANYDVTGQVKATNTINIFNTSTGLKSSDWLGVKQIQLVVVTQ